MDALPPEPPAERPLAYAPTDISPRDDRERELCKKADSFDWVYGGAWLLATAGAIYLDGRLKESQSIGVRMLGPVSVGFAFGGTLGGGYLALPKCNANWVVAAPAEGKVRASWPTALALAMLAGTVAPFLVGIETGPLERNWTTPERSARLIAAGVSGFTGALVPYLLPPKTWRAAKELERLRLNVTSFDSASIAYSVRF